MDVLRDPIWQFVSFVISAVALIFGLVSYWQTQNRKSITYKVISDTFLHRINDEFVRRLEIRFDNKVVNDVRLVVLKFWNSGNSPISPNDYIEPIKIEFEEDINILDAVSKMTSNGMSPSLTCELKAVTLAPFLLNSTDSVLIKVLLTGHSSVIKVQAGIIGVEKIIEMKAKELNLIRILIPVLSGVSAIIIGILYIRSIIPNSWTVGSLDALIILNCLFIFLHFYGNRVYCIGNRQHKRHTINVIHYQALNKRKEGDF